MQVNDSYISVKFSEPQLRERNRVLSLLLDMSNFLSTSMGLSEVLEGALSKVLKYFGLQAGRIYLIDDTNELLILAACLGVDSQGLETIKTSEGFSGRAFRTRSFIAQNVSDLEDEGRAALLLDKGFRVVICVPLIAMDRVVGVMNLAADRPVTFDQDEIDLLIVVGNQIAVAANNARLYEDLARKVKELKVQKDAIEFFAYSISHDLKSPAVGIFGLTNRLYKHYGEHLNDKGRQHCEQIMKAAEQISRLVDRINAYIMAKEAVLHFERFPLRDVLETIRGEFLDPMNKRHVQWTGPESPPEIVADRICITRVLRNLVDNALKYGGENLTQIEVGYREEGEYHILSVSDDGIPLKVEDPEALFQLFHRNKTSKGVEGTGLGLATVKEIAERHMGRVWLEAGTERGTAFHVAISRNLKQEH